MTFSHILGSDTFGLRFSKAVSSPLLSHLNTGSRSAYCSALKLEAIRFSEPSVHFYQNAPHHTSQTCSTQHPMTFFPSLSLPSIYLHSPTCSLHLAQRSELASRQPRASLLWCCSVYGTNSTRIHCALSPTN